MISAFDENKLRQLLKDFYQITKIRITVFDQDLRELVSYPEEISDFCKYVRSCETGRLACSFCDREACEGAARERRTQVYRCHAGLTEAVTPLGMNGVLIGYLFFGQVFSYPDRETGRREIEALCRDLPIDREKLIRALAERPLVSEEYIRSSTHILLAVASYLVMERMATLRPESLPVRLDRYLSGHFTEKCDASTLCRVFGIGKTRLYKLSSELYGCGIAEHVRDLRLARAKELLSLPEPPPLSEISQSCGYDDYNYFIAVFSRAVGCPPGAWKKKQENSL